MDIILHVGAHRSGTTTFQQYLRDHAAELDTQSIGFWGPGRTRKSIFPGLFRPRSNAKEIRRSEGRVQMHLARTRLSGLKQLLVSDENMIGSSRHNLRASTLYPAIGERMARVSAAFGGQITRVVMTIRAQDLWWASAAAYTVARGHPAPSAEQKDQISQSARTWRDVITDLACAVPDAEVLIIPFEQTVGQPTKVFSAATGAKAPLDVQARWLNRSPHARDLRGLLVEQGADISHVPDAAIRWQPFSPEQTAQLRENYADDLHWLMAGGDGLATLTEDPTRQRAGTSLPAGHMTRGHNYDNGQGHMARSG
ncbi:MAG: hypothetical protein WA790_01580 [Sulfitobacter sp.]